jgi:hypothetical protein
LLHFLAVLIHAGEEKHIFTFESMVPRNHIGEHHLVSVPDMWRRVRVIDGCSDEKRLWHLVIICSGSVSLPQTSRSESAAIGL